jgi:Ala-tRNA(Pro) deacylase
MTGQAMLHQPDASLLRWLRSEHMEYELHAHEQEFSARSTAAADGTDPHAYAKVVGLSTADGRVALAVVEATDQVDLVKARRVLDTGRVRLLSEAELTDLAPECEVGAIPAIGDLYGLRTYADFAIRDVAEIVFNAGSHSVSVRVDRQEWERACHVVFGDLAVDAGEPAWARS